MLALPVDQLIICFFLGAVTANIHVIVLRYLASTTEACYHYGFRSMLLFCLLLISAILSFVCSLSSSERLYDFQTLQACFPCLSRELFI